MAFTPNALYYGDCLEWMREWESECVDLIYLDPPFNSNANYNVLFKNGDANGSKKAQYRAFTDTWYWDAPAVERYQAFANAAAKPGHDCVVGLHRMLGECGMLAYLTYMAERLIEIRRILKPTGSVYLHCYSTASHALKLLMDSIFDAKNFLGDISWNKCNGVKTRTSWGNENDNILCYAKGIRKHTFNISDPVCRKPYSETSLSMHFRHKDEDGRLYRKRTVNRKTYLYYADEGRFIGNLWDDIPSMTANSPILGESLGYATQKPLALLDRIVRASSNEGDIVLDPFCGCGTAVDAARRLNRQWAGIDISSFAIDLILNVRLKDASIPAFGIPADMPSARKLAKEKPFDFESWAVTRLPGFAPNTRQVADGGVDGRATLNAQPDNFDSRLALAQVKGGNFNLEGLRSFASVLDRDNAALGYFISLDAVRSAAARAEAAKRGKIRVQGLEYDRLSLWSIEEYFQKRLPPMPVMTNPYTGKPMDPNFTLFS